MNIDTTNPQYFASTGAIFLLSINVMKISRFRKVTATSIFMARLIKIKKDDTLSYPTTPKPVLQRQGKSVNGQFC